MPKPKVDGVEVEVSQGKHFSPRTGTAYKGAWWRSRADDGGGGMKSVRRALGVAAIVCSANPVLASDPKTPVWPKNESLRVLSAYANCVVSRHEKTSEFYLIRLVSDSAFERKVAVLNDSACLGSTGPSTDQMSTGALLFAIAIGEAMFRRRFAQPFPLDASSVKPLAQPAYPDVQKWRGLIAAEENAGKRAVLEQRYAYLVAQALQLRVGECVVRQNSAGARVLTQAPYGTMEEEEAMNSLTPALSACLAGTDGARFNRHLLKGVVGLSYVRLALSGDAGSTVAR